MKTRKTNIRQTLPLLVALALIAQNPQKTQGVVTSDAAGTHVTSPGVPVLEIDHDGVVQIIIQTLTGTSALCTGALLEGGLHVLTAGHCVDGDDISNILVRFTLASGVVNIPAEWWMPRPGFVEGSATLGGMDIGIITLTQRAPAEIPRYSPLRTLGLDIDNPNVVIGYGNTGHGLTGRTGIDGEKRWGRNMYEATGPNGNNVSLATVGGSDDESWLFSDFDSGLPENDGFGFHFGKPDLGFGDDEGYASAGDSGAPIFVSNGFSDVIAGVVSGGLRFFGTPNADVDGEVNGTWGQFSRDTRVAAPDNLGFITPFFSAVLEPQPLEVVSVVGNFRVEVEGAVGQTVYIRISNDLVNWEHWGTHRMTQTKEQIEIFSAAESQANDRAFLCAMREPVTPPVPPGPLCRKKDSSDRTPARTNCSASLLRQARAHPSARPILRISTAWPSM